MKPWPQTDDNGTLCHILLPHFNLTIFICQCHQSEFVNVDKIAKLFRSLRKHKMVEKWDFHSNISGNDLGLFSDMATYSMTLLKGKRWSRLLVVGKGWSYCVIWWKGEIMHSWRVQSQTHQDGYKTASENACQKPAANSRSPKRESHLHMWIDFCFNSVSYKMCADNAW